MAHISQFAEIVRRRRPARVAGQVIKLEDAARVVTVWNRIGQTERAKFAGVIGADPARACVLAAAVITEAKRRGRF